MKNKRAGAKNFNLSTSLIPASFCPASLYPAASLPLSLCLTQPFRLPPAPSPRPRVPAAAATPQRTVGSSCCSHSSGSVCDMYIGRTVTVFSASRCIFIVFFLTLFFRCLFSCVNAAFFCYMLTWSLLFCVSCNASLDYLY